MLGQAQQGSHRLPASTSAAGGIASSRPLNLALNSINRLPFPNTLALSKQAMPTIRLPETPVSSGESSPPVSLNSSLATTHSTPTSSPQTTSVTAAQLPSSRLQLKVQPPMTSISPFQAAFQSTLYSNLSAGTMWNQQMQAFANNSKALSNLTKTLNQGIRQIPNPSLLAKQQQQATEIMQLMAAAAANARPAAHQ